MEQNRSAECEEPDMCYEIEYLENENSAADKTLAGDASVQKSQDPQNLVEVGDSWSQYNPAMLRTPKAPVLKNKRGQKSLRAKNVEKDEIVCLKKKVIEESSELARIQHEQRLRHEQKEHEMRIKILELDFKIKELQYAQLNNNNK